MFDFGFSELLLIGVIALVVLGPERLPKAARMAGQLVGRVQRLLASVVERYVDDDSRPCRQTLRHALVTPRERLTPAQLEMVDFLSA